MQMSSRVNGVFRIHDLPPETFIRILMHLRDSNPPIQDLSMRTRAYETKLGWINATHTSLYWRNTLLSNPSFWTRMPFSLGKTWVDAFVHRCQSLPFDIRLETGLRLFGPWVYEFCATYFHRVRDFEVGYSYDMPIDDDPIYALLERPSTTLQALSVDRMWRRLEYPRMRSSQYPRLRSLHIDLSTMDAGDIPWRDIGPSELADLSVTAQRPSHIDRILSDVVYCLQRLQALVTLKLNLAGQRDNHHNARAAEVHNNGPVPSVTLPNLEKVMLYAVAGELTPMLNHINFPASTLLTLVSYGCIEREPFLATLQPLISVHSKLAPFRHILFSDNHEGNLQLSADASTDRSRNTGQPDTYLRLALSPTVDFFPDILPAIGPDQIYHIDIRCTLECSLASDVILPCFATQLRNVTCISVALSIRAIANPRDGFTPAGILAATLRRLLLPTANSPFCPFPRLAALDSTLR